MHLRRVGLLLLLLLPSAFAVQPIDLTIAVPIVAVTVGIFLAMMTMFGTSIADPRLQAWAKTEIREFIAGLILIAIIVAFFVGVSGVAQAMTGETDYVKAAQDILDEWSGGMSSAYEKMIKAATRLRTAASFSPYINIPVWYFSINYSTNPLGGVALLLGSLNMAASGLTNAIFLAEAMKLMLVFIKVTVPKILLPLAFCLRLIPFTRRMGNTLIAAALAGIVFLPFGVILADELNGAINYPQPTINLDKLDAKSGAMVVGGILCESKVIRVLFGMNEQIFSALVCLVCLPFGCFEACRPLIQNTVYPLIINIFQLVFSAFVLAWEAYWVIPSAGSGNTGAEAYAIDAFKAVQPFLRDISNLVLVTYLDFILIGLVTIGGARSLSAALGGEWYMAGIQRLI